MKETVWDKPAVQDARTKAFIYSDRGRDTSLKRAIAWWKVETARPKADLLEAAQSTTPFSSRM